jgi:hypothetical protein
MVVAYLREQFCMLQRDGPVEQLPENRIWPGQDIVGVMPRVSFRYSTKALSTWLIPIAAPSARSARPVVGDKDRAASPAFLQVHHVCAGSPQAGQSCRMGGCLAQ